MRNAAPARRANSQASSAVRRLPRWSEPVGDGAYRPVDPDGWSFIPDSAPGSIMMVSERSDEVSGMNVPMNYVEPPDCPEGMTLREYRRKRRPTRPSRRRVLMARLRGRRAREQQRAA